MFKMQFFVFILVTNLFPKALYEPKTMDFFNDAKYSLVTNFSRFDFRTTKSNNLTVTSFEFCETQKGEVILTKSTNLNDFYRFIDLYVILVSGYRDFSFYTNDEFPPIGYTVERLKTLPFRVKDIEIISDFSKNGMSELLRLNQSLAIEKYGVNYDEGARITWKDDGWPQGSISLQNLLSKLFWALKYL